MTTGARFYWFFLALMPALSGNAQAGISVTAEREQMFRPYLAIHHGGPDSLEVFRRQQPALYYRDLWYYASSFYVKRNHYPEGYALTEKYIDISRYESQRLPDQEAYIRVGGTCDAIVLLPANKLLHKPSFIR